MAGMASTVTTSVTAPTVQKTVTKSLENASPDVERDTPELAALYVSPSFDITPDERTF